MEQERLGATPAPNNRRGGSGVRASGATLLSIFESLKVPWPEDGFEALQAEGMDARQSIAIF